MGFESPAVLFALVAASVPLIIHLLLRRRARVVPLDSLMVLVLSEGVAAVRLRWAHRALIALRMLLIALIVVAFARPYVLRPVEPGLAAEQPISLGLVLDNSLSMRATWGGETSWRRAQKRARRILEGLPPESEVFVALAGRPATLHPAGGPGWDAGFAARFVSRLDASQRSTDLAEAVRLASEAVRRSPHRDKRVVIVSDFADPTIPDLEGGSRAVEWVYASVGPEGPLRNATLASAAAFPAPDVSPGHVRVQVSLRNDGPEAIEPLVTVRLGLHTAARKLACESGATCEQEFLLLADPGVLWGEVRLPPDDLNDDNVRFFALEARDRNAVLLVNGAPRRRQDLDEAFFLERALRLRAADHPGFSVQTLAPAQVSALHLSTAVVVALLNVAELPEAAVEALSKFVEGGGGLLVTAGDNATGGAWQTALGGLLPGRVRDAVDLGDARARWMDPDHPLAVPGKGILSARVNQVAVLEPGWPRKTKVLAEVAGGLPLLVERVVGRGVVLVWLATVDRDWTDFPLRPGFPPFMRAVFAYLSRASGSQARTSLLVGETRVVEVGERPVTVVPPGGREVRLEQTGEFCATETPGAYRVEETEKGETRVREVFVVNVDPEEGVFSRAKPPVAARGEQEQGAGGSRSPTDQGSPVRKVPLTTYLVGLLLVLLLVEGWLRAEA